jgi:site-specific DNA-methyltransferase (adenine-specific)
MIRLGRWQDVLADVKVDCILTDPPYSSRTHDGLNEYVESGGFNDGTERQAICYASWTADTVAEFIGAWSGRVRGWWGCMTSHDLIPAYEAAYRAAGLYAFSPVPIIQKRPRLVGDGPSSWAVYMMVARPKNVEFSRWGCLPGAYEAGTVKGSGIAGTKPLGLMRAIVRDYSKPGDLVCDPFVGSGTTAIAALSEGRRFVGSEMDPKHHAIATARLARGYTPDLF